MNSKTLLKTYAYFFSVLFLAIILYGCGKENKVADEKQKSDETTANSETKTNGTEKTSPGKELFYLKSSVNNIACADCHSDGTNSNKPLTKFFSNIQGANKRTSTYSGKFTGEEVLKNAGGATICWESYERMKTPLTAEQINSLNEYYGSVATSDTPTDIKYETIALPTRDKTKLKEEQKNVMAITGDPGRGAMEFNNACGSCHGNEAFVKKVPDIFDDFEGNEKSIIYNVRLGDGAMPFFVKDRLTDRMLANIAAFIMQQNKK
ncbi:MAG TPA: c-type cytochrome [Ignavibacteria bacterium]|nr:c-type cytochrome [Ignavibacteria bacterium]HMR39215.1 c-type cytochrome [Ignavibacteria bacterium]